MIRVLRAIRRHLGATAAGVAVVLLASIAWATPGAFGGYTARITNSTDSAATAMYFSCANALAADKSAALFQWPLNDAATGTAGGPTNDISGANRAGVHVGATAVDATAPLACPRDGSTTWSLDGATQYAYFGAQQTSPMSFTIEVWFKTSVAGGKLIGFGSSQTGASASYDRHLYINSLGQLVFGVYSTTTRVVTSTATVTDNAWHHAAGTFSPTTGIALYLDGKPVASDGTAVAAQMFNGYWRVGYDSLVSWPNAPASSFFKGRLRFAAVYTSVLSATLIQRHYLAGI